MLGAYTTFWLFARTGLNPILSLLITMPLLFLLGAVIQRYLVGRVVRRPLLISLLMTFGISLFLSGLAQQLERLPLRALPQWLHRPFRLGLALSRPRLVAFTVALALSRATYAFLRWGRWGRALRATSQDPDAALVCGVDVDRALDRLRPRRLPRRRRRPGLVHVLGVPPDGADLHAESLRRDRPGWPGELPGRLPGGPPAGTGGGLRAYFTTTQIAEAVVYLLLVLALLLRPSGLFGLSEPETREPRTVSASGIGDRAEAPPRHPLPAPTGSPRSADAGRCCWGTGALLLAAPPGPAPGGLRLRRHLLLLTFMYTALTASWNLISGYTGYVSFGHAAFFGVGAYSAGILLAKRLAPWPLAAVVAGLVAPSWPSSWATPPCACGAPTSPSPPWAWRRWCSRGHRRRAPHRRGKGLTLPPP